MNVKTSKLDALLICNGDLPDFARLRRFTERAGLILAADGGANNAIARGIEPHIVIGDLDSVTDATRSQLKGAEFIRVEDQNLCDFEKALDFLVQKKHRRVSVTGIEGQRFDFTLSNFSVIWRYVPDLTFEFFGADWRAYPIESSHAFHEPIGTTISFVPFGRCEGLTLEGLRYPLEGAELNIGQIAVSNVVTSSPFSVKLGSGRLLMIVLERAGQ